VVVIAGLFLAAVVVVGGRYQLRRRRMDRPPPCGPRCVAMSDLAMTPGADYLCLLRLRRDICTWLDEHQLVLRVTTRTELAPHY